MDKASPTHSLTCLIAMSYTSRDTTKPDLNRSKFLPLRHGRCNCSAVPKMGYFYAIKKKLSFDKTFVHHYLSAKRYMSNNIKKLSFVPKL